MLDAGRHPRIQVATTSEIIGLEGKAGDFTVRIRTHPRLVREDLCVACGLCVEACPQLAGNEFDVGLKARRAIYRPFPQSEPAAYVIDRDACLNDRILVCDRCVKACEPRAIDFDMPLSEFDVHAGAVLVAIGFQEFDARALGHYGYGRFPDVVTSLELERMLNATGVTGGHVVRPSDRKTPRRIVFIQCVGARGEGGRPYCSRFCCMNAVKDSMLVRQHDPEVEEITILHTDIRAFGKGFDDFVQRSRDEASARYVRGRPSKVDRNRETGGLEIFVEDTLHHDRGRLPADLVVLSVAAAPNDGAAELAGRLGIEADRYGFIARRDPAISAVETTREGIFVCGSAVGPQVIPDCVAQASAAAARAQKFLAEDRGEQVARDVAPRDLTGPPRVGVLVCHCGSNIAGVLGTEELTKRASGLPGVVAAAEHQFACSSTGQGALEEMIREHDLNRVVVAACTPRTHEPVFRGTCAQVGFNPYLLEMVNIRDQCSWVHAAHPELAQEKAHDLIRMGVARARHLEPLIETDVPMIQAALVVGGGIAGIQAATDLADQGFPVTLVEKEEALGGFLRKPNLRHLYPTMRPAAQVLKEKLRLLERSGARVLMGTEVDHISGYVGNFEATLSGAVEETLQVGAIVLAFGASLYTPTGEYGYGGYPNVVTSHELEGMLSKRGGEGVLGRGKTGTAAFILCVGSREPDGFTGCSRYCCPTAIKQATELAGLGIQSVIFYRDIRTVSTGAEEMYREARGLGVLFSHVGEGQRPAVLGDGRAERVESFDPLLDRRISVPVDLVVLGVGMAPRQPETAKFHDLLKASLGLDGFFLERHPELAPVETAVEGVFIAGTVQGPKDIVDSVAQASAAAARAATYLAHERVKLDPAVAVVDPVKCRACGRCVDLCLFHGPKLVQTPAGRHVAEVNASLCKGCGTCGSWCPSGAITSHHFTDTQIHSMIEAFFG
ncbi:MAG: FAD-dependent oxidoreductase [Pseudomonadota bacterium]